MVQNVGEVDHTRYEITKLHTFDILKKVLIKNLTSVNVYFDKIFVLL